MLGVVGPRDCTLSVRRIVLERRIIEGDNPVFEIAQRHSGILSNAEHVKFCANLPGPSGKAKYSCETDSEIVP